MTIAIVVAILLNYSSKTNEKSINIDDPELARAMTYGEFTEKDEKTNSDYVRFGAFFLRDLDGDGYAEKVKGTCKELGKEDTLYMQLSVITEGKLKNGKIEIIGDNSYFHTALVDDESVKGNYISENTKEIYLKDIGVGTQKLIFGNVRSGDYRYDSTKTAALGNDTTKYSGITKIILTGTHVADDGTETKISKTVELNMDWYNTPKAEIPYTYAGNKKNRNQSYTSSNIIDLDNNKIDLNFKIVEQEIGNMAKLSKAYIEGEIPELNGYKPIDVTITGKNVTYTYDNETRKYTAQREAVLDSEGKIIEEANSGIYKTQRYNEYNVTISYPVEAYESLGIDTLTLNIPVRAYYEGYNNPNEEFSNPVRSNIAEDVIGLVYEFGGGDVIAFDVKVGKYVAKPYDAWVVSKDKAEREYQGESDSEDDTYTVLWSVARGADGVISNVEMKETPENYRDQFLTTDNQYKTMDNIVSNQGIYFKSATNMFGEDGYINVINDETGEIIHTFTQNDWNLYNEDNPYIYSQEVKHIRIETSEAKNSSLLYVYNIKKINNEKLVNTYSREEFDKLSLIYSYLTGYIKYSETDEYKAIKNDQDRANYDSIKSIVNISGISPNYYSTQETKENVKIKIKTETLAYNTMGWVNGEFLLKMPKEILGMEINNVTINNKNVEISGYSLEKREDGYYLRIITSNEMPETYEITVDCNIAPDPRILTASKNIELYSYNEICPSYKTESKDAYDVNEDGNTVEFVGKSTIEIQLIGPTSLITIETASEYNENHDELETSIAPQIAIIDKSQEEKTAKVSASIINNYSGNISGIKLVGKIPFEGNIFQLTPKELGSMYTVKMTGPIIIPEAIRDYVTVYYSEKEEVTQDINDKNNVWIAEKDMTDYSNVRTYLIDLGSYVMKKGEEQICIYQIELPEDLNYNDVSYSTHAVYFYLETEEGKLYDKIETNKLGFMIAKKYNLEIDKKKVETNIALPGASYQLLDEQTGERRIATTNEEGKLTFKDLYVEKTYILEEVKAPNGYEKSDEKIKIQAVVNNNGELEVKILEGTVKNQEKVEGQIQPTEKIELEDEPKYNVEITKFEKEIESTIANVQYELSQEGVESKRTVTTNKEGKIEISNLIVGTVYELKEVRAKGYYIEENPIKFKLVRTGNTYKAEILSGKTKNINLNVNEKTANIPELEIELEDEKVPEYTLRLNKYAKDSERKLEGATYKITGPGIDGEENYKTDENGKIDISELYEYVAGKNVDGIYTIKEIVPPQGYILNEEEIQIKATRNEEGNLELEVISGTLREVTKTIETLSETEGEEPRREEITEQDITIDQENNIISIGLEDEPLFKLIKIDGTTKEVLPNTKFVIKEIIDENTEGEAKDTKGNPVGEIERINGEEYRVVTTNVNGEISVELRPGLYKIIEIEAVEGYKLPEQTEERTYYFGIGKSTEEMRKLITKGVSLEGNGSITGKDIIATEDGGYVMVGQTNNKNITIKSKDIAEDVEDIVLETKGYSDGIIIKYNAEDKVEWARAVGGTGIDQFKGVTQGKDGDYVAIGSFYYNVIIPSEETESNTGDIILENKSSSNHPYGIIIKYNNEGKVKWAKVIGGTSSILLERVTQSKDGGYVAVGMFYENVVIPSEETISNTGDIVLENKGSNDGLIIKYNVEGKVEWARAVGGTYFYGVTQSKDGGYVAVGYFQSEKIIIPSEETVSNTGDIVLENTGSYEGIIIQYNTEGKVEWAKTIGGKSYDILYGVTQSKDGGYIVTGYTFGKMTIPTEETSDNAGDIVLQSKGQNDLLVIKYNTEGKVEWARTVGGTYYDFFYGVTQSKDGGYVAVGSFESDIILIPSEDTVNNSGDIVLKNKGSRGVSDGLIIKYNEKGKVEWAKTVGGAKGDELNAITVNKEGAYLTVGTFKGTIESEDSISGKEEKIAGNILKLTEEGKMRITGLEKYNQERISEFNYIMKTDEGSYIAVGNFSGNITILSEETVNDIGDIELEGYTDGLIVKYNVDGKVEWAKGTGGIDHASLNCVAKGKDGGYVAVGMFYGNVVIPSEETVSNTGDIVLENKEPYYYGDGIAIKYNEEGKIEWAKGIGTKSSYDYLHSVTSTEDGGYIAVGYFWSNITIPSEETASNTGDIVVENNESNHELAIKYNKDGKVEWARAVGGTSSILLERVTKSKDGGYVAVGYLYKDLVIPSEETVSNIGDIVLENKGYNVGLIVKYDVDGKVEWAKVIGGTNSISLERVTQSKDGDYVAVGYSYGNIIIPSEETVAKKKDIVLENTTGTLGIIVEYNKDGLVKNAYGIDSTSFNGVLMNDNKIVVAGQKNGTQAMILEVESKVTLPEIADKSEITVENEKKQYKITTEVKEIEIRTSDGNTTKVKGGTISGDGSTLEAPYETVEHGKDSREEIKITPDEGFKILKITINDEEVDFTPNEDGTVILDKFTNMTSNKHVVVEFSNNVSNVIVHHYLDETGPEYGTESVKLSEDENKSGEIGKQYTTAPQTDLDGYILVEEKIPSNASGKFTEEVQEVIYYYKKAPAKLIVHYYLEGTTTIVPGSEEEQIEEERERNSEYATSVATGIDSKYEVVAIPENAQGTLDENETVVTYYYRIKDAKVIVHHYIEGTTTPVPLNDGSTAKDDLITGKVTDSYETHQREDTEEDYELVAVPENATGEMTEDEIVVIYYYRKKATQVIVHHYEEGTTNKLSENVTIDGRVDDPYTTEVATDVPIKYELVANPVNKTGTMTEDVIEVTYYYRVKDAILNIRYLEKGTNKVLADPEQQTGKVDEAYITESKQIDGYTLVEDTGNTTGNLTVEPITVTFYYLYNTKATVQYIDKTTGAILEQRTQTGLEGDEFVTESKSFDNYILVEEPAEKTVNMTKDEIVLKYYYIHVSGGVIEKHIDVISGEILANESYEGNEGDPYNIPSRTFAGYDLVEDRLPINSQGTMQVNPIEVTYYYIYKTKVTVKYVDKETGEELAPTEEQTGHETDRYTTERKIFDDYKLEEVPANADGTMTKGPIEVIYYYIHTSGGVIVNHVDVNTGKQLRDETKQEGYEGDSYETHEENIPGYDLVQEKYPTNSKGTMTKEPTRVIYYYIKKTEVNVKYIDEGTGEEIEVPETIPGHEGDDYSTESKKIPGYDLVEGPENKDGTMTDEPIEVIYKYKRPAKVVVRYLDEETKEELATEEKIEGHQNDDYTTKLKDIQYYTLSKVPENATGKMTVTVVKDEAGNEVVEDTTYVTYYYRKKIFNLRVDKQITSIIVNGEEKPVNGNLGKVELNRTSLSTTSIQVVYKIVVTNNSELKGKTVVLENIPEGMTMRKENNEAWEINEEIASLVTDEIQPGESREYKVVLDWVNDGSNIGTKENIAQVVKSENEAGFEEKDITDDESSADLIISIGTGIGVKTYAIIGSGLAVIILAGISVYVMEKKKKVK